MLRALLLATLLAAPPRPSTATPPELSEEERAYCAAERGVIEKRRKVFEAQRLAPAEIARRNEPQLRALKECRERFQAETRRALERKQDLAELARRAGPNATELERERIWREVRRERLAARPPSSLTPEERAELSAGTGEEHRDARRALDASHRRDPRFMRVVHDAIACYYGERQGELREALASEERMVALGTGDKQNLYRLRSELRQADEALAANREASGAAPKGPGSCTDPTVAAVSNCLRASLADDRQEPPCDSEELQQYVRLAR